MAWRKYFKISPDGRMSPLSGQTNRPQHATNTGNDIGFKNYASTLPEVYLGHPNRIERYNQYESMDLDSEINACLDILSEFSTQANEQNNTPFDIVFSDTPTDNEVSILKKQLQQWTKLNQFDQRMFKIFRNAIKYGDQVFIRDPETFELYWIDMTKVSRVIVNESKGKEPEQYVIRDINPNFQNLTVAAKTMMDYQISPVGGPTQPAYTTPGSGGSNSGGGRFSRQVNETTIDAKHVVHLSMGEGLDVNWPFGTSILETIFKVFKQKELLEDAILIYRVQRAPERRVFYIDVGNMPSHMAMAFVDRVKNEIHQRRIPTMNGGSGSVVDAAYSPLSIHEDFFFPQTCLSLDTKVKLLDNKDKTLKELISDYENGVENYAFTVNQKTLEIEPGKIVWAGITRTDTNVIRVWLDNDEFVECTRDHRFIMRDGSEKEAGSLEPGDSIMPLYLIDATTGKHQGAGRYLKYIEPSSGKSRWVHTMVCPKKQTNTVIHHIDCNSRNNHPANLIEMDSDEHIALHRSLGSYHLINAWKDDVKRKRIVDGIRLYHANATSADKEMFRRRGLQNGAPTWENPESRDKVLKALLEAQRTTAERKTIKFSERTATYVVGVFNQGFDSIPKMTKKLRNDDTFQEFCRQDNPELVRDKNRPREICPTDATLNRIVGVLGYTSWGDFKSKYANNHKVVRVESVEDTMDTGDLTIESASGSHNFALTCGIFVHNSEGRGSKVETLPGGDNLGCFPLSTKVRLLDGRDLSIRDISDELSAGKELWTYSCHPITGEVAPGLISWAGKTKTVDKLLRITLDNGEIIECTHDHKFPIIGEGFVEAKDLFVGKSLIPLYTKKEQISEHKKADYEQFFDPSSKTWKYTHRHVMNFMRERGIVPNMTFNPMFANMPLDVRHHKDHNRFNNSPDNLVWMNWRDHQEYHQACGFTPEQQAMGTIAARQAIHSMKTDAPELYRALLEKQNVGRSKWRKRLTQEQHAAIYRRQSISLREYYATLSGESRVIHAERCKKNFAKGTARVQWLLKNDADFREAYAASISDGIRRSKDNDHVKWANRSNKITAANIARWKIDGYYDKVFQTQRMKYDARLFEMFTQLFVQNRQETRSKFATILTGNAEFMSHYAEINSDTHTNKRLSFCARKIDDLLAGFSLSWESFKVIHTPIITDDTLRKLAEIYEPDMSQEQFIQRARTHSVEFSTRFRVMNLLKKRNITKFDTFAAYAGVKNHRVVAIEELNGVVDVGTLSIDSDEIYHDYHTFALSAGVFVKNSIDDLKYFNNKMARGLRVPSSYLPTGPDDQQTPLSDGRVGTAMIQEYRFNQYCKRLQNLITTKLDDEFKMFLRWRGFNIDASLFTLKLLEPQNFATYRQSELDSTRVSVFSSVEQLPYMSKRFLMKRFLGMTEEEISENEEMWREEHDAPVSGSTGEAPMGAAMRSVGVMPGDMGADIEMGDELEGMSDDMGADAGGMDMAAEPGAAPPAPPPPPPA